MGRPAFKMRAQTSSFKEIVLQHHNFALCTFNFLKQAKDTKHVEMLAKLISKYDSILQYYSDLGLVYTQCSDTCAVVDLVQ